MLDLKGKLALVTGGGSGIGRAVSLLLAEYGADVAVHYRNSESGADDVVNRIRSRGGSAAKFRGDLTNESEVAGLFHDIRSEMRAAPCILVNNAGHLVERRSNGEMTEELYGRIMDVNLKSVVLTCKYAIPGMKEAGGGRIVNMSSLAAHNGGGLGATVYAAGKAAVNAYTKGLAKELAGSGIRVNAVSPGFIGGTAFHDTFTAPAAREAVVKGIPLGREGTPEDVAGAVLFLVSGLSDYVTGETVEVNGGMSMR